MILIVGLGNPGEKYAKTRHNVGFMTADYLRLTIDNISNWKLDKKTSAFIAEGKLSTVNGQKSKVVLAKPRTLMNNSGKAVRLLTNNLRLTTDNLIIVHDDIDLPLGEFRIQKGRGAAGHKGVQSIIKELGRRDFWRVRMGICPENGKPKNVEKFVLQKFTKEEEGEIMKVIRKTTQEIEERNKKE